MTAQEKLVKIALAEVGYKEKRTNANLSDKTANSGINNYTKYADELDKLGWFYGKKNGYSWCSVFVSWCFYKAFGQKTAKQMLFQPTSSDYAASCTWAMKYFKNNKAFYSTPQVGDQVFFGASSSDASHTGIVVEVSSTTIKTVEGNTNTSGSYNGDGVYRKSYSRTNKRIIGYGRPKWSLAPKETATTTPTTSSGGTASTTSKATYKVVKGDTLSKIASKYGLTLKQLLSLNPQIKDPNKISVGQVVFIAYIVERGDTLSSIAKDFGTTVAKLAKINGIANANKIEVGQVIKFK